MVERAGGDLLAAEADEGVAVAERVVHEGERFGAGEGHEPEREAGEVDGERVLVDAVEAPAGDEPPGAEEGIFVRVVGRGGPGALPGVDEVLGELPAGLDQERARAHRGIADAEGEDRVRSRRLAKEGAERALDDEARHRPRGVVRAEAPPLLARPQREAASGLEPDLEGEEVLVHAPHVLDLEVAVRDALAVLQEEQVEHAEDGAVRDAGDLTRGGASVARGAAFEEGVGVGVEEPAAAPALVKQAEEREHARPRAVMLVDRAPVLRGGVAELFVQARDLRFAHVREEGVALGEEGEHHPHERGDEAGVDAFGVASQETAAGGAVGDVEGAHELGEGRERLRAQGLAWGSEGGHGRAGGCSGAPGLSKRCPPWEARMTMPARMPGIICVRW